MMFDRESDDFDDEPTNPDLRMWGARVLIVEGNADRRWLIGSRMRHAAFDVLEVSSGYEALDVLTSTTDEIDLLVIDEDAPEMSGLDVARVLHEANRDVRVVLIAGSPDPELLAEAERLGLIVVTGSLGLDRLSDVTIAALQQIARA